MMKEVMRYIRDNRVMQFFVAESLRGREEQPTATVWHCIEMEDGRNRYLPVAIVFTHDPAEVLRLTRSDDGVSWTRRAEVDPIGHWLGGWQPRSTEFGDQIRMDNGTNWWVDRHGVHEIPDCEPVC